MSELKEIRKFLRNIKTSRGHRFHCPFEKLNFDSSIQNYTKADKVFSLVHFSTFVLHMTRIVTYVSGEYRHFAVVFHFLYLKSQTKKAYVRLYTLQ